jgi:hypothetical protein
VSQFDGIAFTEDLFSSSAAVGNWQSPLLGDFDNDSKMEVLARDLLTGDWWMFGDDDQTPQRVGNWSPTVEYDNLSVVDIDGDGFDDVVGRNSVGSWWGLLFQDGSPQNVFLGQWRDPANWGSMLFGDVDGDGAGDILGRDLTTGYWWQIAFDGQQFQSAVIAHWNPAMSYSHLQLADMDGDGVLNVVGFASDNDCWVIVKQDGRYLNVHAGRWDRAIAWEFAGIGDLDGNGSADIAARNPESGEWMVMHSVDGGYRTEVFNSWNPVCNYSSMRVIDIDGDGLAEIIGLSNDREWWATKFNGTRYVNQLLAQWTPGETVQLKTGDFDGNGSTDVAAVQQGGAWQLLSHREGAYIAQLFTDMAINGESMKASYSGDIDGNGQDEWIAWGKQDGLFRAIDFSQIGAPPVVLPGLLSAPIQPDVIYQLDIDGDKTPDAVTWDHSTGCWFKVVASGAVSSAQYLAAIHPAGDWQTPLFADVDGNGAVDIVLRDAASGNWWAIRHLDGQYIASIIGNWNPSYSYTDFLPVDLDGDGGQEIVGRAEGGEWWALNYQQSRFRNIPLGKWPIGSWKSFVADLDGNGSGEIVGFNPSSHQWQQIRFDGASFVDEALATWPGDEAYDGLLAVDLDGDGADEMIGRGQTSGRWRKLSAADPSAFEVIAVWGGGGALQNVLTGDFDGDGHDELIAQSRNGGVWGLLDLGSGGYTMRTVAVTPLWENAQAVDFNLDGGDELVWQDRSTATWYTYDVYHGFGPKPVTGWLPSAAPAILISDLPGYFDSQLRAQLYRDLPGLADALATSPLDAAQLLRDWAANAANFDSTGNLQERTTNALMNQSVAQVYYEQFLSDRGAVICGGFAFFYSGVLKLFGIDNFFVDFGDQRDGLTHVTVIVPVKQGDAWQYFILDPTFNLMFVDKSSGQRMTWFELLDALNSGATDRIGWYGQPTEDRDWLSYDPNATAGAEYSSLKIPGYGLQTGLDAIYEALLRNGYSSGIEGFVQLMDNRVYRVGQSLRPEVSAAFVEELRLRGIPFGSI